MLAPRPERDSREEDGDRGAQQVEDRERVAARARIEVVAKEEERARGGAFRPRPRIAERRRERAADEARRMGERVAGGLVAVAESHALGEPRDRGRLATEECPRATRPRADPLRL